MQLHEHLLLCATTLYMVTQAVSGQCNEFENCFCITGIVSCSGLSKFPTSFPEDTTTITISHLEVDEIPTEAFTNLPALHSVEIFSGTISQIQSRAFSKLSDFERVSLGNVKIGTIESEAFSDLSDFGTLSIYRSSIELIESRAFSRIFALDTLRIFSSNITKVETGAFYMLEEAMKVSFFSNNVQILEGNIFSLLQNLGLFEMYHNDIKHFGNGTLEHTVSNSDSVSVYSNTFACNCQISYLLKNRNLTKHLFSNWCNDPVLGEKVDLAELSTDDLDCKSVHHQSASPMVKLQDTENLAEVTNLPAVSAAVKTFHMDINDGDQTTKAIDVKTHTRTTFRDILTETPEEKSEENKTLVAKETVIVQRVVVDGTTVFSEVNAASTATHPVENLDATLRLSHSTFSHRHDTTKSSSRSKPFSTATLFAESRSPFSQKAFSESAASSTTKSFPERQRLFEDVTTVPNYEIQNDQGRVFAIDDKTNRKVTRPTPTIAKETRAMNKEGHISAKPTDEGTTVGTGVVLKDEADISLTLTVEEANDTKGWATSQYEQNSANKLKNCSDIITVLLVCFFSVSLRF